MELVNGAKRRYKNMEKRVSVLCNEMKGKLQFQDCILEICCVVCSHVCLKKWQLLPLLHPF